MDSSDMEIPSTPKAPNIYNAADNFIAIVSATLTSEQINESDRFRRTFEALTTVQLNDTHLLTLHKALTALHHAASQPDVPPEQSECEKVAALTTIVFGDKMPAHLNPLDALSNVESRERAMALTKT